MKISKTVHEKNSIEKIILYFFCIDFDNEEQGIFSEEMRNVSGSVKISMDDSVQRFVVGYIKTRFFKKENLFPIVYIMLHVIDSTYFIQEI